MHTWDKVVRWGAVATLACAVAGCVGLGGWAPGKLALTEDGASPFTIVVPADCSPSVQYAAEELQHFLQEMSGAALPIQPDTASVGEHEIILGDNAHLKELGVSIDFDALGDEGYVLRTQGPHLVIAGSGVRGTLYGVYGLLEDHLGCRWFTPTISRIPERDRIVLPKLNETVIPALEYREPFTVDCFDADWNARNRMNGNTAELQEKHGGKVRFGGGLFVHTFNALVPPEKYFDEHPEYFSEINGERVGERTQLCCTNEDVIRIITEEVRKRMRADPDATAYSVSQNDWYNYCRCPKCRALAEKEDSEMAPVLQLVNRVAEAVEDEFPDKAIETLAYQWTRKPPKTMTVRPNVIIRLCTIECCFMHSLEDCDLRSNQSFVRDIEGWAKIANRLWIWDYVTSFSHYLVPFPNLRVRDDNIKLFVKNNVTGIFEQDVYTTLSGELSPLSGYLNAKLLWNPAYEEDTAINEFLDAVYGDAAKPIRQYIDMLHDKVAKENIHARIWVGPCEAGYITDEVLAKSHALWDEAEKTVADDPEVLERVGTARLAVDYASIERLRVGGALDAYTVDHDALRVTPRQEYQEMVDRFFARARRAKVNRLDERGLVPLDGYEKSVRKVLRNEAQEFTPLAPVQADVVPGLAYAHYAGQWQVLPDFASLTPVAEGVAEQPGVDVVQERENFALRFTGYVSVPRNGMYTFVTASNDGSRLFIGDTCVVDNDGLHRHRKNAGFVALKAGLHPITVEFFQEGGDRTLEVSYSGPGIEMQPIPKDVLFHAR